MKKTNKNVKLFDKSKIKFDKVATTYEQQIELLKSRGMVFNNEDKAKHLLEYVSYYRLSGYWFHIYESQDKKDFVSTIEFDTAFAYYCFDKDLRNLINSEIEKIEVAIRAKISYYFAHKIDMFWFMDKNNFVENFEHEKFISNLKTYYKDSKELFVTSFKSKYSDVLPPTWILLEIIPFGSLSYIYKNLRSYDKKSIANEFKLNKETMKSWFHSLVYLRNMCAHHSRLFNKSMSIKPVIPLDLKEFTNIDNTKVYFMICIIRYFLRTINKNTSLQSKLQNLFDKYPLVDKSYIDFNEDWGKSPIWLH